MGDDVAPKNENSTGLVAMTRAGSIKPSNKARPIPDENKRGKFGFISPEKPPVPIFFEANCETFLTRIGKSTIKIANIVMKHFFAIEPCFERTKAASKRAMALIAICKKREGFFVFITIFFAREKRLFKIQ